MSTIRPPATVATPCVALLIVCCAGALGQARQPTEQERLAIAEHLGRLAGLRANLGLEHANTAAAMHDLGQAYDGAGQFAEAERWYEQAKTVREKVLAADDIDLASTLYNLATICNHDGRYAKAERYHRRALAIRQKALGEQHPLTATSLNDLGLALDNQGKHARAVPYYERALSIREKVLGPDHWLTALTLHNLGLAWGNQLKHKRALPCYERALAIRVKVLGENHADTAWTLNNLAAIHATAGRWRRSLAFYQRAHDARHAVFGTEHRLTAISMHELGDAWQNLHQFQKALKLHQKATAIRKRVHGATSPEYAESLTYLATTYLWLRDFASAEPLLIEAVRTHEEAGREDVGYVSALQSLAGFYKDAGDHRRSLPLYKKAHATLEKMGATKRQLLVSQVRMAIEFNALGQYDNAEPLFDRTLPEFDALFGENHPLPSALRLAQALMYQQKGDWERCLAVLATALKNLDENSDLAATGLAMQARAFQAAGRLEEAGRAADRAAQLMREIAGDDHYFVGEMVLTQARVALARRDRAKAVTYARSAMRSYVIRFAAALTSLSERMQLKASRDNRRALELYLSCLTANADPTEAYQYVLLWKGAVFARQLRMRLAATRPEFTRKLHELQRIDTELATLATGDGLSGVISTRVQIDELSNQKERLERDLLRGLPAANTADGRAALQQLRVAIPHDAVLVDLFQYTHLTPSDASLSGLQPEDRIAAFIVAGSGPVELLDLGSAERIATLIDQWRRSFGLQDNARKAGDQLRRRIWSPLEPRIAGARLVLLSPDGALSRFPFAALPGKREGSYLLEEQRLAIIPVSRLLPELSGPRASAATDSSRGDLRLLLVGDVDYGAAVAAAAHVGAKRTAVRFRDRLEFAQLPATRSEIETVRDLASAAFPNATLRVLHGGEASEDMFRQEAARHNWLHLATHGFFAARPRGGEAETHDDAGPIHRDDIAELHPGLLSGIAFAGVNRTTLPRRDDGILTALEVASLNLSGVQLAVLSACETGLGEESVGEGLLSLQRTFQIAGARSVIGSLWKVHDEATQSLMARFYQNLWRKRMGKLDALREAQLWMLREARKSQSDGARGLQRLASGQGALSGDRLPPYYWAAFVLSGDWR